MKPCLFTLSHVIHVTLNYLFFSYKLFKAVTLQPLTPRESLTTFAEVYIPRRKNVSPMDRAREAG